MRKANAGHYEGKSKTADWWARFIALPSLIVSVLMFYHGYVTPGELKFTRPNICHIAQWADNRERLVVVIPVVVTNTGAVVHTVSYLTGVFSQTVCLYPLRVMRTHFHSASHHDPAMGR